ncbi:MAG: hypothetical protein EXR08_02335 [Alphaproteobacteria bacterium]|nr:hypothetical protein [Alphaproteobacteria bacterium]
MNSGGSEPSKSPYHRLLIGFSHHAECRSVLYFAAHVAQAAGAELEGVFVEDLLDLARFPFATEILSASGVIRNFDSHRAESDLRAIAKGMHDALCKLAGEVEKHYSFHTIRGHLLRDLIALGGEEDLILFQSGNYLWGAGPQKACASRARAVASITWQCLSSRSCQGNCPFHEFGSPYSGKLQRPGISSERDSKPDRRARFSVCWRR